MGSKATLQKCQGQPIIEKVIKLTSSDGEEFFVTEKEARQSPHLAGMICKEGDDDGFKAIALGNVPGRALRTVTKYCQWHAGASSTRAIPSPRAVSGIRSFDAGKELEEWDRELVRGVDDVDALYDLLVAANFLRLDGLTDTVCRKVASIIKDCETPKKIRETFRIPDDLTAEDKEKIRKEYAWAFGPDDI